MRRPIRLFSFKFTSLRVVVVWCVATQAKYSTVGLVCVVGNATFLGGLVSVQGALRLLKVSGLISVQGALRLFNVS